MNGFQEIITLGAVSSKKAWHSPGDDKRWTWKPYRAQRCSRTPCGYAKFRISYPLFLHWFSLFIFHSYGLIQIWGVVLGWRSSSNQRLV